MTCEEARVLVHALIDGELDAGHARDTETHVATCPRCAAELRDFRVMRRALAMPAVQYQAPAALRARRHAPTITDGLDVLVHEVIAAITTSPWPRSCLRPSTG